MKCPRSLSLRENGQFFLSELHCLKKKSKDDCSVNVIAALFIRSIYTVSFVDIIEIC